MLKFYRRNWYYVGGVLFAIRFDQDRMWGYGEKKLKEMLKCDGVEV